MSWLDQIKRIAVNLPELKQFHLRSAVSFFLALLILAGLAYWLWPIRPPGVLLNVAFDASLPLFSRIDAAWQEQSGKTATSLHAGSVQQSKAVAKGLVADTICVASPRELDALAENERKGLVAANWRERFPSQASPFHSVVVFLVRKEVGDRLHDWPDLLEGGLRYAVPAPDISGCGQYAYLGLAYTADQRFNGNDWIFSGVLDDMVILPHGARRATERFLQDRSIKALITWESEALRVLERTGQSEYLLVYPRRLIRIEPVVAIAEAQTGQRSTHESAQSYLNFLFSPEARHHIEAAGFRPNLPDTGVDQADAPVRIETLFGSWKNAVDRHLSDNGSYHRLLAYRKARAGGSE